MRKEDRPKALVETVQRTLEDIGNHEDLLEHHLFETLYEERIRLETEPDRKKAAAEADFYRRIAQEMTGGSAGQYKKLLHKIIEGYAEEVGGHFDPIVHRIATRLIPPALSLLLNATSPLKLLRDPQACLNNLEARVAIEGHRDQLVKLARMGTIIIVPTHSSNLDSILIGFALYKLGLPPFLYGAGLNLFHHRLIGFFMSNLGAYTVDRRKKCSLYKQVLKNFAGVSMEMGYHNIFFPGGTRSRSNRIERNLKRGLLGMGLSAYIHNLIGKQARPDVFIVPCTINYQLILEGSTLIEDHLKEVGKSRYIIEDDEFSRLGKILSFVHHLSVLQSDIRLVIGEALDVFGNRVDLSGCSNDGAGRPIERKLYVYKDGIPGFDEIRDQEYTRHLAQRITDSYCRNTVVNCTNLVCFAIYRWLVDGNPELDLFRLLRMGGKIESLTMNEAVGIVDRTRRAVLSLARMNKLRIDSEIEGLNSHEIIGKALAHLGSYHDRPVLERRGDRVFPEDRNLLYFYHNRLTGFGLEAMS